MFIATLLLMVPILLGVLRLGAALDLRSAILNHPRAGSYVSVGDTQVEYTTFLLEYAAPDQLNWLDYHLVRSRSRTLWAALYTLSGLVGGIAALWLELAGIRQSKETKFISTIARTLVGGISGFLVYLVLILPAPFLVHFVNIKLLSGAGEEFTTTTLLDRSFAIAILAGLFGTTFYHNMEHGLIRLLGGKEQ